MADSIVIVSAARTPIGGMLGDFSALAAHQLGSVAIRAAVERAGVTGDAINEVLMGNCLMAGQGQAPARLPRWVQGCRSRSARSRCRRCAARACAR